jgi:hypothetical protein
MVNKRWLKSLGPELEAIVREEARKAEVMFAEPNAAVTAECCQIAK